MNVKNESADFILPHGALTAGEVPRVCLLCQMTHKARTPMRFSTRNVTTVLRDIKPFNGKKARLVAGMDKPERSFGAAFAFIRALGRLSVPRFNPFKNRVSVGDSIVIRNLTAGEGSLRDSRG